MSRAFSSLAKPSVSAQSGVRPVAPKTKRPGLDQLMSDAWRGRFDVLMVKQAVFQRLECWKCHGVTGRGNGPSADTLTDDQNRPIKPFDFHDVTRFKCGAIYKIFMTGLNGTPMPSFADSVKPDEAWETCALSGYPSTDEQ